MIVRRIRYRGLGDDVGSGVLLVDPGTSNWIDSATPFMPSTAPVAQGGSPTDPYPSDAVAAQAAANSQARVAADSAIASMRRVYAQLLKATTRLPSILQSSQQQATAKNVVDLGPHIEEWAVIRTQWAQNGTTDFGIPYGWDKWIDEGKVWSDAIRSHAQYYAEGSAIGAALDSLSADFDQVAAAARFVIDAAKKIAGALDNAWVWWAVGLGVAGIVGYGLYRRVAGA